ncbi:MULTISPECIES: DNA primase family protein [Aerococcus]|uniref:DNA primase n=2 Tax=Aerococcus TaxID=1375 RepID=A0A2I1L5S5_9LACT|nr:MULTISPECIES: DNA primase family protein [Aerococcus]KAA9218649.1 DNA primase [Aerococcus loyolae]KAA9264141.1 DNA primase [Aerococcus loyolae]MCY3025895.1 phage/plasmid primase, P4 family [Aerococcus loyolae]MCY3027746.1 phage/plasmid primase, P4 family [Aerococcus loyolae]MCY3029651.1 phage/plasmid primase, P4 family [Aerococcus loyolae]
MSDEFKEILNRANQLKETEVQSNEKPQTMREIRNALSQKGQDWKIKHKDPKTKKFPKMHEGIASTILRTTVHCYLIGDNRETAMLAFYDPDQGIYITGETNFMRLMSGIDSRYRSRQWKEVIQQLRVRVPLKAPFSSADLIPVNNGIYSVKEHKLLPFSPDYAITSKIATNYNANATNPIIDGFNFDEWLKSIACGDDEIVTLLWQVINEALNPNHTRNKIGFLIGSGNSGKGTFQQLLINLIGKQNVSTLKPPQFSNQYDKANLIGKVCNIGDDISNAYIDEISDLMSIATGDPITVEEKYQPIYSATLKLFCLFSGNDMPNVRNKSLGWYRRLLLIPFNADFNGQKNDPKIKEIYLKDKRILEYVLKKAIEMDFTQFIEPEVVKKEIAKYRRANDYIEGYINDEYIANGYHELEKAPSNFIKHGIKEYKYDLGNRSALPYGFMTKFIDILERLTENKYRQAKQRINVSESESMPEEIQPYAKGSNPIRIIQKIS